MRRLLSVQPLLTTTVVTAVVDLAVAYGLDLSAGAKAPIIVLITALATALVHQSVVPPATLAAVAKDSATKTAESLTTTTVGKAGEITATGRGVAAAVAHAVTGAVGGLAGRLASTKGAGI